LLFVSCIGCVSAIAADDAEWGSATGGIQLKASVSAKQIRAGEALSLNVSIRNASDKSLKILPFQKSCWSRFFVSFDKAIDGNPNGPRFVFGTRPELAGLNPAIPMELKPGESLDAAVSLLSSDFFVYRSRSALDETPLFSFSGQYRFNVLYEVDEETAAAFGIDKVDVSSRNIEVEVVGEKISKQKEPEKKNDPYWIDPDGRQQPIPASTKKIDAEDRKQIEKTFNAASDEDAKKYEHSPDFDYTLRYVLQLSDSGRLYFSAATFDSEWKRLSAKPKRLQALRERMMQLESILQKAGIDAHASGQKGTLYGRCGNK